MRLTRSSQVYVEVTKLFKDAPDLLDEFKQFLPDNSQSSDSKSRVRKECLA